jgi:peptide/nickel transport system permease protein
MLNYIARRLLWMLLTLIGISVLTFLVTNAIPADPARLIVGPHATLAEIRAANRLYGFDKPVWDRYLIYLGQLLHGNFGYSYISRQSVGSELALAIPVTASLALAAVTAELLIGIPVGIWAFLRAGTATDGFITTVALVFYSMPPYWLGSLFLLLFAFKLGWFPLGGYSVSGLVLPALTVGVAGAAQYARILRASMLEIAELDYVRTARSKGVHHWTILFRHVFRNALIPFVTLAGLDLGSQLGGLIITEVVFALPGLGKLTQQAIFNLDEPTVMGVTLFAATAIVVMNLVVDILYAALDPRISYS